MHYREALSSAFYEFPKKIQKSIKKLLTLGAICVNIMERYLISIILRVQFNGRIPAFQAGRVGSIPITRSILCLQLSRIEQLPSKQQVGGSNPSRHAIPSFGPLGVWWVQLSWLQRQVVALEAVGSNPITHPIKIADCKSSRLFCFLSLFSNSILSSILDKIKIL